MNLRAPTPYDDLNAVLADLAGSSRRILDRNFVGAYLQGSFAVGDFDEHSDVDFIVVTAGELSQRQLIALREMHGRIYALDCRWAQHLEGSYFPKKVLRHQSGCGFPLWYIDNGSQVLERSTHDNTLVVRSILYHHGVTLDGPPPQSLIDPIPIEDLRAEIGQVMSKWAEEILLDPECINNHFYQSFAVLQFCRAIHDIHTGRINSKRAGAAWVKANLDPAWSDLIDRSWSGRPGPELSSRRPADSNELNLTVKFIRYIATKLKEARTVAPAL